MIELKNRIESIDVMRGVAILGILLVNAPTLNGPPIMDAVDFAFQTSIFDRWYADVIFALAVQKFYPIFALLFGVSMSIFLSNKPKKLFLRRQLGLLLLGLAHAALVWWGDILTVYAILGVLILPMSLLANDKILKIIGWMLGLGFLASLAIVLFETDEIMLYQPISSLIYGTGSFLMVTKTRIADFFGVFLPGQFYVPTVSNVLSSILYFWQLFILQLSGYYLHKSGLLKKIAEDKTYTLKALNISLSFTVCALLPSFVILNDVLAKWQGIMHAMVYVSLIFLWCRAQKFPTLLKLLANVGRMSLTNYLFQTVTLSLLFYGYGLGLYGQIGPFMQLPIILTLMSISLLFSSMWLKYFNFGPVEWLWRSFTYGKAVPMKKKVAQYQGLGESST